jgi:predicted MFS family arabinose efflux permease
MKKSLLILFAIAGGFAVGNLYFVQPLLARISQDLGTSTIHNGWLVTSVQLGYAFGIILLLPLGDVLNRKKFVPVMMTLAGLGQLAISFAPNFTTVAIAFLVVGFTTISGQVLVPLTSELSDDSNRGSNSGLIVSGMIIGILAARTISGSLSDIIGWHGTFAVIGGANIALALALYAKIPQLDIVEKVPYPKLVTGIFSLWKKNPWVLRIMLINAMGMMLFSALWTSITFFLSAKPYSFTTTQIGLLGLVGIVGAIGARFTGKLIDSGRGDKYAQIALGVAAVAMAIGSLAPVSLVFMGVMLLMREFAGQTVAINNQTQLIAMFPHARSRVNAGYVSINFLGQAAGSAIAVILWPLIGWVGMMLLSSFWGFCALAFWIYNKRTKPAKPTF